MEEATVFTCAQSAPLNREPIVCADIGTAHSAAVTGEECVPKSLRGDLHFRCPPPASVSCGQRPQRGSRGTLFPLLELCGAGCSAWWAAKSFRGFSASLGSTQFFLSSLLSASGQCYTFGSNQHGQLGTNSCRNSRVPHLVVGLQAMKVTVVACGDAFTVAIGAGEAEAPVSWAAADPGFPLPAVHAVAKASLGDSPGQNWGDERPVCW